MNKAILITYIDDRYDYCKVKIAGEEYLFSRTCKLRSNGMPVPLLRNGYSIFNGTKYR